MTMIVCSKCSRLLDVTARTVNLPYECDKCEEDRVHLAIQIDMLRQMDNSPFDTPEEPDQEAEQFYEDIAPAKPFTTQPPKKDCACGNPELHQTFECPELTDEFATVGNTTKLIEDLEDQLIGVRSHNTQLVADLSDAEREIRSLQTELDTEESLNNQMSGELKSAIEARQFWTDRASWYRKRWQHLLHEREKSWWRKFLKSLFGESD